jgi:hypothetical protein
VIKLVKLTNGEDLIADIFPDDLNKNIEQEHTLSDPMCFHIDYRNNSELVLQHYLPIQLVEENRLSILSKDILSIVNPNKHFIEYYTNTMDRINRLLKAKKEITEMSEEEITNIINQFEMEDMDGGTLH